MVRIFYFFIARTSTFAKINRPMQFDSSDSSDFSDHFADAGFWRALHLRDQKRRAKRGIRAAQPASTITSPVIRGRVFTDELKNLALSVQSHQKPESSPEDVGLQPDAHSSLVNTEVRFSQYVQPLHGLAASIAALYMGKDSPISSQLLASWNRQFEALASAILLFSREDDAFRLMVNAGLPEDSEVNFWISARDPFFSRDEVQSFAVDLPLKQNPFFAKRFSVEFLASVGGIVSIPRNDPMTPLLLVFFFDEAPPLLPVGSLSKVLSWIHPILLRRHDKVNRTILHRNVYEQAAREVRAFLNLEDGGLLIQFDFDRDSLADATVCQRFLDEFRRILSYRNDLIVLRLRHDGVKILIADESARDPLMKIATELALGFGISLVSFQMPVSADHVSSLVL